MSSIIVTDEMIKEGFTPSGANLNFADETIKDEFVPAVKADEIIKEVLNEFGLSPFRYADTIKSKINLNSLIDDILYIKELKQNEGKSSRSKIKTDEEIQEIYNSIEQHKINIRTVINEVLEDEKKKSVELQIKKEKAKGIFETKVLKAYDSLTKSINELNQIDKDFMSNAFYGIGSSHNLEFNEIIKALNLAMESTKAK